MTRNLLYIAIVSFCLFTQSGCGIISHQVHRATSLLMSPLRVLSSEEVNSAEDPIESTITIEHR